VRAKEDFVTKSPRLIALQKDPIVPEVSKSQAGHHLRTYMIVVGKSSQ